MVTGVPGPLPGYLLAKPDPPIPILSMISSTPVLSPSGRIHDTRGYDPQTGVLYLPRPGAALLPVSSNPPKAELQHAVEVLLDVFVNFPFQEEADSTTVIAAVLLPFLRPAITGPTPLHLIHKPSPGTGATLLVNVISLITTGRLPAPITEASDDDEWRKRLTAYLLQAPTLVLIDNINRDSIRHHWQPC